MAGKFQEIGNRHDWIALGGAPGGSCLGLTADGGLWIWEMPLGQQENPWLPPSRRPHEVALLRAE